MQLSMFLSATSVAPFLNSLLIISQRILFVNRFSKLFQKVFYGFSEEFSRTACSDKRRMCFDLPRETGRFDCSLEASLHIILQGECIVKRF